MWVGLVQSVEDLKGPWGPLKEKGILPPDYLDSSCNIYLSQNLQFAGLSGEFQTNRPPKPCEPIPYIFSVSLSSYQWVLLSPVEDAIYLQVCSQAWSQPVSPPHLPRRLFTGEESRLPLYKWSQSRAELSLSGLLAVNLSLSKGPCLPQRFIPRLPLCLGSRDPGWH